MLSFDISFGNPISISRDYCSPLGDSLGRSTSHCGSRVASRDSNV